MSTQTRWRITAGLWMFSAACSIFALLCRIASLQGWPDTWITITALAVAVFVPMAVIHILVDRWFNR